jgi:hypothetical protein
MAAGNGTPERYGSEDDGDWQSGGERADRTLASIIGSTTVADCEWKRGNEAGVESHYDPRDDGAYG